MPNGLEIIIRVAAVLLFFLIAGKAIHKLWQHNNAENLYFAFFFSTLAVSATVIELARMDGVALGPENRLFGVAIAAHPFLLMMLISTIRPVPRLWLALGAAGLILTVVLVAFAVSGSPTPQLTPRFIIPLVYFFSVQLWGANTFWREAQTTLGVQRNRYIFIVAGMLLLAAMMGQHLVYIYAPATPGIDTIYALTVGATAAAYLIGFEPPSFVRRLWQIILINRYQSGIIGRLINKPADQILRYLATSGLHAVGGQDAILVHYNRTDQRLSITTADETVAFVIAPEELDGLGQLSAEFDAEPRYLRRRAIPDVRASACILDGFRASAMFSVPVIELPHSLTLLLVTMRSGTLFVEEDLSILISFAEQARTVLENNSLIAETQGLVEELRDETGDLEEMVIQRETALRASEDELRRRLVQMSALYRELEAFSYSVSHDLRGPLRAITGFSNALLEDFADILPPQANDYLQRIATNSLKMGDLMNSMLKLSKLSRSDVTPIRVDLTDMAVRVTHELRAQHPMHDVAFQVDPGLVAYADTELVKILLTNLLGNAWKYTRDTEHPAVSLRRTRIDGEYAFAISDNGAGFEMTYSEKLFKPFQRLHSQDEFEGSGVGLAIVQRIVNRHGGRVWAESQPGNGARFYFTLPAPVGSPL